MFQGEIVRFSLTKPNKSQALIDCKDLCAEAAETEKFGRRFQDLHNWKGMYLRLQSLISGLKLLLRHCLHKAKSRLGARLDAINGVTLSCADLREDSLPEQ